MTERELVEGCKNKNINAQKQVYERYASKMLGICVRYVGNNEVAHDVLHDGFIRLFDKIASFQFRGSLDGWIRKLFVNICLEFLRKEKKMQKDSIDNEENFVEIIDNSVIYAYEKMSAEELINCIEELPPMCRVVFNLFAIEGFSHEEIAKMLKISNATSRSTYFRARSLLQQKIKMLETNI